MSAVLDFTGERYVPGAAGAIAYEHCHRYAFARRFVEDRRVLDAACGEGYGTALIGAAAREAIGVDVDPATIEHAQASYGAQAKVRYVVGSVAALPFEDASFDVVVSFETIEHVAAADQPRMLAEFARVLRPGGLLVLSSPNRRRYSDERNHANPFHVRELYRDELATLLDAGFPHRRWFHQQPLYASAIRGESPAPVADCEAWAGDADSIVPMPVNEGLYFVVLAAASADALPPVAPGVSLFTDHDDTELARADENAAEVLRLDTLLKERDQSLDRQSAHLLHLEALVAERERIVAERDLELAAVNRARAAAEAGAATSEAARAALEHELAGARTALAAARQVHADAAETLRESEAKAARLAGELSSLGRERRSLDAALAAQERVIAYQQSLRGWLHAPVIWLRRARRAWT